MKQEKPASAPLARVTVIDALRGFALLGVILMHMLQHYSIMSVTGISTDKPMFPALNESIQWIGRNVISGKFINIFAFLFGLSFYIQMDRSAKKGVDFRWRFIWRMVILFGIGLVGNCFYGGEIMSLYAVFGLLLVFLYKVRGWVLMLIFSLILLGTPRLLQISYSENVKNKQPEAVTERGRIEQRQLQRPPQTLEEPSFLNSVQHNFTTGLARKLNYQFGTVGRGYLTFALFILGLVVGRTAFFEQLNATKNRNLFLFTGFIAAFLVINWAITLLPASNISALRRAGAQIPFSAMVLAVLNDVSSVLFSAALVVGFMILYHIRGIGKYLDILSPYGRMGLTNYELQSVIGCFLFSMWAFGSIFGKLDNTGVFIVGVTIYVLQLLFSKYWLRKYLYGPLEWLWRSATYLKMQPFTRQKV